MNDRPRSLYPCRVLHPKAQHRQWAAVPAEKGLTDCCSLRPLTLRSFLKTYPAARDGRVTQKTDRGEAARPGRGGPWIGVRLVGRGRRGLPLPSTRSQECFCAAAVGTLPTVPADTVEKLRLCRPPNPWVIPLRSYVSLWVTSLNLPGPRFPQLLNGVNENLCPPGCLQIQSKNM